MTLSHASFPISGKHVDPKIDDYRTEVGLMREHMAWARENWTKPGAQSEYMRLSATLWRWERFIRRLEWAKETMLIRLAHTPTISR